MIDILMPRLSDTMTEGAISTWHKKPGDRVSPGDVLVDIETDKALMEYEAYEAGTLAEILIPEGRNAPIGAPIARLDDGSDDIRPERIAATPLVRRLARERGIDLAAVAGSGPGGRIIRADLETSREPAREKPVTVPARPDQREPRSVPFDPIRQAVAARLTESGTTVPTFTATASADVEDLLALRAQINEAHADTGVKVSVNDLLVRAVALALRAHPGVNASYSPEGRGHTLIHRRIHVGIAVASPAGLVVPVVRDADRATVTAISTAARDLAGRAADRTLTAADMSDGTFTVSNLGMYGVEHFTAIINPPQGAILAVGAARPEPTRRRLRYTITADHRIIDGALAARFLATLTGLLEHPLRVVA
ncbi:dihydrolipoamide acetyltransferase family protein [Herbidospora cretacea]|uniref:dihydrolipoamide acetyltransferase family protein n=1 Tax=Herbidospora cretacea TaxID=28444 RepID=UPI000773FBFD|nr:dihydrolipoamide acetyltransferase family protein [Herbidospora cretacea]